MIPKKRKQNLRTRTSIIYVAFALLANNGYGPVYVIEYISDLYRTSVADNKRAKRLAIVIITRVNTNNGRARASSTIRRFGGGHCRSVLFNYE